MRFGCHAFFMETVISLWFCKMSKSRIQSATYGDSCARGLDTMESHLKISREWARKGSLTCQAADKGPIPTFEAPLFVAFSLKSKGAGQSSEGFFGQVGRC